MLRRPFIPETEKIHPSFENQLDLEFDQDLCAEFFAEHCIKKENHESFVPLSMLATHHLPEKWRHPSVVSDLKMVARRVVQIYVVQTCPERRAYAPNGQWGSGWVTFHPLHGVIINTSKHVVFDPFEAAHCIIRFFYDESVGEDGRRANNRMSHLRKVILGRSNSVRNCNQEDTLEENYTVFRGTSKHFRSVMCSDYASFSCDAPVNLLFTQDEIERSRKAFSWRKSSLSRIVLSPQFDIDVAIISHPHGGPKVITFGKMKRLVSCHPSLYDAATCGGSSGSPVIRLQPDSGHYLSAGQFVHHGFWTQSLNMGMGTVRPPIVFPYFRLLDHDNILCNMIGVIYEPIFYWTLFFCDLLHIESTIIGSLDMFAYFSTLSGMFLSIYSLPFKVLFTGFWLHVACTFVWNVWRGATVYFAFCRLICTFISMSMFFAAWMQLFFAPWPLDTVIAISVVWLVVLFAERHYSVRSRFSEWSLGSFPEFLQYEIALQSRRVARKVRASLNLNTVHLAEPSA